MGMGFEMTLGKLNPASETDTALQWLERNNWLAGGSTSPTSNLNSSAYFKR